MKRTIWLSTSIMIFTLLGLGWVIGRASMGILLVRAQSSSVNPHPLPPSAKQLQQDLATEKWVFTPLDPANLVLPNARQAVQSSTQAIDLVRKLHPESLQASNITASSGMLHNSLLHQSVQAGETVDPTFTDPHPVWIVTLSGVTRQSSGPPEAARQTSNELDVVIDLNTGTSLMDFVWTRP